MVLHSFFATIDSMSNANYKLLIIFLLNLGTSADIMKVGGYKLSALEIEAVLLEVSLSWISLQQTRERK